MSRGPHFLQKRHRDLLHTLQPTMDELGVALVGTSVNGSGHLRVQLDFGHGVTGHLTVPNSPSCPRIRENMNRNLRQLVRVVRDKIPAGPLEGA